MLFEARPVLRILQGLFDARLAFRIAIEQVQGELERLARMAGEIHELEKRNSLRVVEQDGLPVPVHLQPARRGPAGDGREGVGPALVGHGPLIDADGRTDMDPRQTTIGEPRRGRSHGLACGQVAIVRGHGELAGADPELQQPRVDVHERGAPGAREQARVDRVMKVQHQIGASQQRLRLGPRLSDEAWGRVAASRVAVERVQQRLTLEPESLHPLQEGREHLGRPRGIAGRAQLLQPVDVAPQALQAQGVLQVHPEVAATVGEAGDLVDRQDDRAHVAPPGAAAAAASTGRSRKLIRRISRSRMPCRTRASHNVRTSTSRSTT